MVRRERRLQAVETARAAATVCEVWIEQRDGMLRGPRGEIITRDAFKDVALNSPLLLYSRITGVIQNSIACLCDATVLPG